VKSFGIFLIFAITSLLAYTALGHDQRRSWAEVRVGSELEFRPYAFLDENGQPAGFSIDLIKAVANSMDLKLRISSASWDSVWNGLLEGRIDVLPIVAKLPERTRLVHFSVPHTETFDAFFVREGAPVLNSISMAEGKQIVVMRSDAAHHELLERHFIGKLITVNTIPEGLSLIAAGKYDAFLCPKLIGTMVIKEHGIKRLIAGPPIADYKRVFSFAVKNDDTELLEKLNQGLLIVKTNGEYDRIYSKWLTADDPWRKYQKFFFPALAILLLAIGVVTFWILTLQLLVRKRTRELAYKNEMLLSAHRELEQKVVERTSELKQANVNISRINAELNAYAHTVAHDLKGPLSSIILASDMLLRMLKQPLNEKTLSYLQKSVEKIELGAKSAAHFVDEVLALAEAGQAPREISLIDISSMVTRILSERAAVIESKNIQVTRTPEGLGFVFASQAHMYQIFANLIDNAIRYSDPQAPHIQIQYTKGDSAGFHQYLIKDNGMGISPDVLEHIFLPFYKAKSSGHGLGLATVHKIAGLYGGAITAFNDQGAAFRLELRDFTAGTTTSGSPD